MHQHTLKRQRLSHLCDNQVVAVIAILFGILILAWVFRESVDPVTLYVWVGVGLVITLFRAYCYVWAKKRLNQPDSYAAIETVFLVGALTTGIFSGIGSIIFAMATDMFHWVLITFIITAYVIASVITLSALLPVFAAYFFPAILPITVWFFLQDDPRAPLMGSMLLIFILLALYFARMGNRVFADNFTLFVEKVTLSESLESRNMELEFARKQADIANTEKSRFLAAASHDMRQPMQAMRLYIDVLDERLDKTGNQTVTRKLQEAHRDLSDILERCLDISQLDSGSVKPKLEVFDLSQLLHRLHEQYLPLANSRELSFQMHLPANKILVNSDPFFIKGILSNLISNAIRYTDRETIFLAVKQRGSAIWMDVCDNGPGIEDSKQEIIFEEFVQLGNPEHDSNKGTGLGLAIASRMCRLLGTQIHLKSKLGGGSVFSFEVPLEPNTLSSTAGLSEMVYGSAQEFITLAGRRVFVIDDDSRLRDSLRLMLEQWQCQVESFACQEEALVALRHMTGSPDAIIADYHLANGMTGLDAIRQLQMEADADIPALLLTGDTDPERMKEVLEAGFPLLNKPVEAFRLRLFLESR